MQKTVKITAIMQHSSRCTPNVGLVASGNAVRYEHPVHKDANGKIVDDVSLAFGHPVTINYVRPKNLFFLDKNR